ncbi:MAG: hypothetical protein ACJ74E_12265, partial [Actinomycetes bacterium]
APNSHPARRVTSETGRGVTSLSGVYRSSSRRRAGLAGLAEKEARAEKEGKAARADPAAFDPVGMAQNPKCLDLTGKLARV